MVDILSGFNEIILNVGGSSELNSFPSDYEKKMADLQEKGFYNSEILICRDYSLRDGKLFLQCLKIPFFEYAVRKQNPEFKMMVNLNAIIETTDSKIILIKRAENVFDYPGFLDFPAGILPADSSLLGRLQDRILNDSFILPQELMIDDIRHFVELEKSFAIYYLLSTTVHSSEVVKRFDEKNKTDELFLIEKDDLSEFVSKHDKIFPKFIKDVDLRKI